MRFSQKNLLFFSKSSYRRSLPGCTLIVESNVICFRDMINQKKEKHAFDLNLTLYLSNKNQQLN